MRFEPKTDFSVVSALNSNSLLVKKKRGNQVIITSKWWVII